MLGTRLLWELTRERVEVQEEIGDEIVAEQQFI